MKFLHPEFLFALSAIAIPLIIHLFNFRKYKKLVFTNVSFLREIKEQTQNKSNLKHLLVLFSRILFIAFLVLAFAQPYFPKKNENIAPDRNLVCIYLDNSFSMNAEGENGRLFERARTMVYQIIEKYPENQQYLFLTNNFESRHQYQAGKEDVQFFLDDVQLGAAFRTLPEILAKNASLAENFDGSKSIYLISDFQESMFEGEFPKLDSTYAINLLALENGSKRNLYIDSVWFNDPIRKLNQPENLKLALVNDSEDDLIDVPVKLFINNTQKALGNASLAAGERLEMELSYLITEAGNQKARVEVADYPIVYDDVFYFTYKIDSVSKILLIHQDDSIQAFQKLFSKDPNFKLETRQVSKLNMDAISDFSLLILHGVNQVSSGLTLEMQKFVDDGGTLCIFPGKDIDMEGYNSLLKALNAGEIGAYERKKLAISDWQYEHAFFKDVFEKKPTNIDYPKSFKNYIVKNTSGVFGSKLISLANGNSFLSLHQKNEGKTYLFSNPLYLSSGNFSQHALFVPTMYQIALSAKLRQQNFHFLGAMDYQLSGRDFKKDLTYLLRDSEHETELIPDISNSGNTWFLKEYGEIQEAGIFEILERDSKVAKEYLALNYHRNESEMKFVESLQVKKIFESNDIEGVEILNAQATDISFQINSGGESDGLWKIFLILAIIFIFAEILLLKFLP